MRKKLLAVVLSVSLLSALFAGCGNSDADNTTEQEAGSQPAVQKENEPLESGKVALRIWVEESNIDNLQKMIDSFKQNYAGQADFEITIEASGDADTRKNVLSDIHNAADVFSMPDDQLYSLIAGGALSPVANQDEVKAANLPDAVDAASYQGTVYAYPYAADNGYFLYYDKEYFSDSDVQTFDRILEVAAENEKKISMEFNSGWYLYSFFGNTGLDFGLNEDGVTNYCNWNATEGKIKGVDVAQALLNITSHPGFVAQADAGFIQGVNNGTCIAGISGVWNAVTIQKAWGSNYGACKLPTYTCNGQQIQMASYSGYKLIGVNAYSESREWASRLAEWISNEENQKLRFELRGQGPANKNAAASKEVQDSPAIAALLEQSEFSCTQRLGGKFWDPVSAFAGNMALGNPSGQNLQEQLDQMVEEITAP